jgi:hypothetical protein
MLRLVEALCALRVCRACVGSGRARGATTPRELSSAVTGTWMFYLWLPAKSDQASRSACQDRASRAMWSPSASGVLTWEGAPVCFADLPRVRVGASRARQTRDGLLKRGAPPSVVAGRDGLAGPSAAGAGASRAPSAHGARRGGAAVVAAKKAGLGRPVVKREARREGGAQRSRTPSSADAPMVIIGEDTAGRRWGFAPGSVGFLASASLKVPSAIALPPRRPWPGSCTPHRAPACAARRACGAATHASVT